MIIILEGADLVGKSTLAENLSEKLGIPKTGIWIDLNHPKPAVISVSKTLNQVIQNLRPDIIFDRSFMSEWVYSKIKNRQDDYLNDLIDEWGKIDNLLLVILYAEDDVLIKRFKIRGDQHFSITDILKANDLYQEFYNFVNKTIQCILIDVSYLTAQEMVKIIEDKVFKMINIK